MVISNLPLNLSPKVAYTLLSAAVTWRLSHYAIELGPDLSGALSLLLASLVGYQAPTGDVVSDPGTPNDALLGEITEHGEITK